MNNIFASQFDEFLNFSNLFLLQISFRGDLLNFRPRGKKLQGWCFENRLQFDFAEHFLEPNHLTLDLFLKFLKDEDYAVEQFRWKSPTGKLSNPRLTFCNTSQTNEDDKSILIFVKDQISGGNSTISPMEKSYIYQAQHIPGFIHNLNGPLSTILGRIELLKMKNPDIEQLEEVISVGYRLQSIMDNFTFKVQNESSPKKTKINLNRLLREEINFLNCDLFFKHQVEKVKRLSDNIPEFNMSYFCISGIFSECYQFARQFADKQKEYVFKIMSYANGNRVGFAVEFTGDFKTPGEKGTSLPLISEGNSDKIAQNSPPALDNNFLAKCMKENNGYLYLKCNIDNIKYKFEFSIAEPKP